jgi:hypothetical protein
MMTGASVNPEDFEGLEQIYELNRLFLHFLRSRSLAGWDCLGLSAAAIRSLRSLDPATLDRLAEFPHALFSVSLTEPVTRDTHSGTEDRDHTALQALQLTILLSAWNSCRKGIYRARAFYGLSDATISRLRATPLSDLPDMALSLDLVRCAFADSAWLWEELFTARTEAALQRLMLVVMQPAEGHAANWSSCAHRGKLTR